MSWREWIRGTEVEPSLYAADFLHLGEQIQVLLDTGARIFHVDVGDGRFIPPVTIGPVVVQAIAPLVHGAGGRLDCHLMIDDPSEQLEQLAAAGADSVTFHVEAVDDPPTVVARAREQGLGVGVAFKPDTPVEEAATAADGADLVLVMSVHPGYSGQAFIPESVERIRRLRALLPEGTLIGVDGGIERHNARLVGEAGATLLVAGSAIFHAPDIAAAYESLATAVSGRA